MQQRTYRSLLFVPAVKPRWIEKLEGLGADAYVLDLEDSVPENKKEVARGNLAEIIPNIGTRGIPLFVRINAVTTPYWLEDLQAVVQPGLTGITLPKVHSADEVRAIDLVLERFEQIANLPHNCIDIQPLLETARGVQAAYDILSSSPRVRSYWCGSARDGDLAREMGLHWTKEGRETYFIRSKVILDGRASGVDCSISGTWVDVEDLDGLLQFATENRDLGYTGMYVIHPSHIEIVNRVFTPTSDEISYFVQVLLDLEQARQQGEGATQSSDGVMVDLAMGGRARQVLMQARDLGMELDNDVLRLLERP